MAHVDDMPMLDAGRGPDHTPAEHPSAVARWASRRQLHVKKLKVVLIAAIIAGHAVGSYTSVGLWAYADAREITCRR